MIVAPSPSMYITVPLVDTIIFHPKVLCITSWVGFTVHTSITRHDKISVLFSSRNDMDEHVVKMVKQFAMYNSSPTTAVRMLHTMGDRLYDRQMVSNILTR
jgi:hypothetical protein